ncbi:MAG: hypothetical protein MJY89_00680 [Bacteroidales bacterium]|nr:hypothetical protein [Bacteroidales bacterium]
MKRFICRITLTGILAVTLLNIIFVLCIRVGNPYSAASHEINLVNSISKLDTVNEPKIIIIGGSGCGFGFDSRMISEHYSMPVINTGTHAGLGLRLQLELFMRYISQDDIVIVVPEYSQFEKMNYWGGETTLRIFSSIYPEGYTYCSNLQFLYLLFYSPKHFFHAINSKEFVLDPESPYSKYSLNDFGDVTNFEARNHQQIEVYRPLKTYNPYVRKLLTDCHKEVQKRNARMLLLPPSLAISSFENSRSFIERLNTIFNSGPEPHFVAAPERYALPDTLYFDTPYHLTQDGVILRTSLLIEDIDSIIGIR